TENLILKIADNNFHQFVLVVRFLGNLLPCKTDLYIQVSKICLLSGSKGVIWCNHNFVCKTPFCPVSVCARETRMSLRKPIHRPDGKHVHVVANDILFPVKIIRRHSDPKPSLLASFGPHTNTRDMYSQVCHG